MESILHGCPRADEPRWVFGAEELCNLAVKPKSEAREDASIQPSTLGSISVRDQSVLLTTGA